MAIAFVRYLAAGLIALAVARGTAPRHRRAGRRPARPGAAHRLIMAAMTALIAALGMVPMAQAVGGFLIAPVVSGLLGILVWGERPTVPRLARLGDQRRRRGACCCGPRPASSPAPCSRSPAARCSGPISPPPAARATPADPLSTLAVQSLLGAALLAPFALAGGLPAPTPALAAGALALGAISAVCHGLTVAAYRRAEATTLAPFLYFNLLTAAAVGFLWFGETLAWSSLVGLGAIAAGGLVTLPRPGFAAGSRFA